MTNEQATRWSKLAVVGVIVGFIIMAAAVMLDYAPSLSVKNEKDAATITKLLETDSTKVILTKAYPTDKMDNVLGQKVEYLEINNNDTINHTAFIAAHKAFLKYVPDSVYKVIK